MMALSLCVGLLIDDAIVVRENIVRHVQMGRSAHDAALAGTEEIGLAVMATTFSIVAVFLPIGFMGGIVGKFFHEFGLTIVAAVLISMFVSFTLDPMLSSIWNDPQAHGVHHGPPVTRYDRTIGRVTAVFDRFTQWLGDSLQGILVGRCATSWRPSALRSRLSAASLISRCSRRFGRRPNSPRRTNFYTRRLVARATRRARINRCGAARAPESATP